MVETPTDSVVQLHVISYLDWQREGQQTLDEQRATLLEVLAKLREHFRQSPDAALSTLFLGGQTVLLDDLAALPTDIMRALVAHSPNKKLVLGPWYIFLDGLMADGETLIRNLLIGRVDAARYNIDLLPVAFLPGVCQTVAQLPQILSGFGIDAAFLCMGEPVLPLPFRWEAPDGSGVLVMNYLRRETPSQAVETQREGQPDGPFLWVHPVQSPQTLLPDTASSATLNVTYSNLIDYTFAVRERLPDSLRPRLKGELHLQRSSHRAGRFSAHIAHKQAVSCLQARLVHLAEPLLALAETCGTVAYPDIQRTLLEHSWRLLLQNMAANTLAGAVSDEVYDVMNIRNRRITDNSQRVIDNALRGLPGQPLLKQDQTVASTETYLVVWNPHGHSVSQVVELDLRLPPDRHPNVLLGPDGEEHPFSWDASAHRIGFRADVAPVGYSTYTVKISAEKTAEYNQKRTVAGRAIGSASGASLGLNGGRLDWTNDHVHINDLLTFYDGGDAGDVWQYVEPQPDVIMKGSLVDVVQVEATPTYERLIFRNRMRIASALKDGRERERGLRVLDLTTTATYYNDLPGIYFRTSFSNTAEDHRLRAHIRTGIDAPHIYADSTFGLVKRFTEKNTPAGDQPVNGLAAVYDDSRGLGVFTRGLTAFEPLRQDHQITLAFTMLRAVGWLQKERGIAAQGAQVPGKFAVDLMLMPLPAERNPAHLLRTSMAYRTPLHAVQYQEPPPQKQHSYLRLSNDRVVLTALKPPQKGNGLIVRLLHPVRGDAGLDIHTASPIQRATRVNLAESSLEKLAVSDQQLSLSLGSHEIVTLHLEF